MSELSAPVPAHRRIFCNRTLNLRSLAAVGCDMDYTLIHYNTEEWEKRAYSYVQRKLAGRGWPVKDLEFDSSLVARGLVLDLELGNTVKTNRFGYVTRASHGTHMLDYEQQRKVYSRVIVELAEPRWVFLDTFFSLSEACLYAQLVDLLDEETIHGVIGYADLYRVIKSNLDEAHMEGELKAEIVADPDRFVERDEDLPLALLDIKEAGKTLMLITNSEWPYTRAMMSYAFDDLLPSGITWRELFDVVIVGARKPSFFSGNNPFFQVVDEERGLLQPTVGRIERGKAYLGGSAAGVERDLKLDGERILYIGDHMFADVHASKNLLRWRTALVVRELEGEIAALEGFKPQQAELSAMMAEKEALEYAYSQLRLAVQRAEKGYGPQPDQDAAALRARMRERREHLIALDEKIAPLARAAGSLAHPRWGLLMRAGKDKSQLARQIERYADVYLSRVSNLLLTTPFEFLRAPRGSLPHDSGPAGGVSPDGSTAEVP